MHLERTRLERAKPLTNSAGVHAKRGELEPGILERNGKVAVASLTLPVRTPLVVRSIVLEVGIVPQDVGVAVAKRTDAVSEEKEVSACENEMRQ